MNDALEFFQRLSLASPWALSLLVLVPVATTAALLRTRRAPVAFPSASLLAPARPTWRTSLAAIAPTLKTAALILLVLAAARPREGVGQSRTITRGVAIMACIDRSYSMTDPITIDGERTTRLDAVKRVFREFVEGNGSTLQGRTGDLIGCVKFGGLADTACPPVQTHDTLLRIVDDIRFVGTRGIEAGTSIGDATSLAAARLVTVENYLTAAASDDPDNPTTSPDPDFVLTGKAIILLTDGAETTGRTRALDAAAIAAEFGIRVHCIGIGSDEGRFSFDESTLQEMARLTGGIYRRATSADSLRAVYQEIDRLEKTEIQTLSSTTYNELFQYPLAAALIALAAFIAIESLVIRRAA